MKKILVFILGMILLAGTANATVGWNKSIPATSENPQAISPDVQENNNAIDLMLQDYRSGHVSISLISTSEIDIGPGGVMLSNSGGSTRLMVANASLTAMSSTNIDTGSISPSSTYYIYAYASSTTATTFSVIYSASSTIPTGITYYQQIGKFTTDGSSNFVSASSNVNFQVGLGPWTSASSCIGNPCLASEDTYIVCTTQESNSNQNVKILNDTFTPPTTTRALCGIGNNAINALVTCTVPVAKGEYYEAVNDGLASLTCFQRTNGS